jgi:DNA-directed RNA polymerase subunit RPC12/RpoP
MKDIRIDSTGSPRCYNCGSKGLTEKRTLRSKALVGVGALLTKKKLKCQRCGEYNDAGNGKPYTGPAARKYRKEWELEQAV